MPLLMTLTHYVFFICTQIFMDKCKMMRLLGVFQHSGPLTDASLQRSGGKTLTEEPIYLHQKPIATQHVHHTDQLSATSSAAFEIHYTATDQLFPDDQLFPGEQLFPAESISYDQADLALSETRLRIAHLSPSFKMLERLLESAAHLDALTWREFEELVANLLEKDGYTVTLGRGTKDGGKDIMATKQLEGIGPIMSIWQAKKLKPGHKVELSVMRELADTRTQHKASKGMMVTTAYLTRGALERVQQDQYLLGKVDRDDLMQWIRKVKRR
jgi:HJR/Mrr/RecB family endonuclease